MKLIVSTLTLSSSLCSLVSWCCLFNVYCSMFVQSVPTILSSGIIQNGLKCWCITHLRKNRKHKSPVLCAELELISCYLLTHVSSLAFKCLCLKTGHCMCQLRCDRLLTVTFVLGKVTTVRLVSILLTAVNTNSCFCSCRRSDRWKDRSWHKLDWWHVRLGYRNVKKTGMDSFWLCVRDCLGVCARPERWFVCEGFGGVFFYLLAIQGGCWPVCVSVIGEATPVVWDAQGVKGDFTAPWAR